MSAICQCAHPKVVRNGPASGGPYCLKCGHWYIEPSAATKKAAADYVDSDAIQKVIEHRARVRVARFKPRLGKGRIKE